MSSYEDRIVCFLDILGFKQHIRETICGGGQEEPVQVENIRDAFRVIRVMLGDYGEEDPLDREITQFSDSVVISFLATEESAVFYSLHDILLIQVNLVYRGMLCRGGVSRGLLLHSQNEVFGPAMVDAYTLESKAALYPRVIMSDDIVDAGIKAHGRQHLPAHEEEGIRSLLTRDSDGMLYVDYLTKAKGELNEPDLEYPGYLSRLAEIVRNGLSSRDPSIAVKYRWMAEALRPHVDEVKTLARETLSEGCDLREAYESIDV